MINMINMNENVDVELKNATPHALQVMNKDGEIKNIPPSGICPRVIEKITPIGEFNNFPFGLIQMGEVEGLPDPQQGVLLIVSRMVLTAASNRADLICPGELVRDNAGKIIACKGFYKI